MDSDDRITALAAAQHGVVTRRQLAEMGLGEDDVLDRLAARRLRTVLPGVLAVGQSPISAEGRATAAVLTRLAGLHGQPAPARLREMIDAALDAGAATRR